MLSYFLLTKATTGAMIRAGKRPRSFMVFFMSWTNCSFSCSLTIASFLLFVFLRAEVQARAVLVVFFPVVFLLVVLGIKLLGHKTVIVASSAYK